jgi:hypothetical protein
MNIILGWLSKKLYKFIHYWKRSILPKNINNLYSEIRGPVKVRLGINSYANGVRFYSWQSGVKVCIGNYCSLAEEIVILAGG